MPEPKTSTNKFLIIVSGPTGVGKSSIAMYLAKVYNAEIFSADSRQIYQEMNIGTAKPSSKDLESIKHHFIGEKSIFEKYSVGHFENEVNLRLDFYFSSHNIAIMAGGTGLYLKAVMEGLDQFPEVDSDILDDLELMYKSHGLDTLKSELKNSDPEYYEFCDHFNHRRIMRALSVIRASGKKYSSFLAQKTIVARDYSILPIYLEVPRDYLYHNINQRVDDMIGAGLMDEAKSLHKYRGVPALETVGYQELFDYFENKIEYQVAVDQIKQNSRRYAKRQMTWFRKHGEWDTFHPEKLIEIRSFIDNIIG